MRNPFGSRGLHPLSFERTTLARKGNWVGHVVTLFFDEFYAFFLVIFVDAHAIDSQALVVVLFVEIVDMGNHSDARPALCRPALKDVNLSSFKSFWRLTLNPLRLNDGGKTDFRTRHKSSAGPGLWCFRCRLRLLRWCFTGLSFLSGRFFLTSDLRWVCEAGDGCRDESDSEKFCEFHLNYLVK